MFVKQALDFLTSSVIIWIIAYQLIGAAIGYCTRSGKTPWYEHLKKSSLTPPGYVFGIVWPLLYCTLAIFGYLISRKGQTPDVGIVYELYWAQMILNWLWSPIFFTFHLTGVALFVLSLIIIITFFIILELIKLNVTYYFIIIPYFLWICFAGYLNTIIVLNN